jgi:hypothetical protein
MCFVCSSPTRLSVVGSKLGPESISLIRRGHSSHPFILALQRSDGLFVARRRDSVSAGPSELVGGGRQIPARSRQECMRGKMCCKMSDLHLANSHSVPGIGHRGYHITRGTSSF